MKNCPSSQSLHERVFNDNADQNLRLYKLYGLDVWPLIRIASGIERQKSLLKPETVHCKVKTRAHYHGNLFELFYRRKVWTLFGTSARWQIIDNQFFAPHIESIVDSIETKLGVLKIVHSNLKSDRNGPASRAWILIKLSMGVGKILSYIDPHTINLKKHLIQAGFSKKISTNISSQALMIVCGSNAIRFFSIFSCPQIGLVSCFYNSAGLAFVHAFKKMKKPVYDIQHGIISMNHFAYRTYSSYPSSGYNCLPTGFLCWSEDQATCIKSNRSNSPAVYGLGYPMLHYLESKPTQYRDDEKPFKGAEAILLTVDNRSTLEEINTIVNSHPDKRWMIRLHPALRGSLNLWVTQLELRPNIDVTKSTLLPIHILLTQTSFHLTAYSSVAIEAEMFGIRTIFISELARSMYPTLFQSDMAKIIIQNDLRSVFAWAEIKKHHQRNTNHWNEWLQEHIYKPLISE